MKFLLFIIHSFFFYIEIYGILEYIKVFNTMGVYGHYDIITLLTFLTFWSQLILAFFYSVSILVDLIDLTKLFDKTSDSYYSIVKQRDLFFRAIVFPIGFSLTVIFWTLYAYDRELIFPSFLDTFFPKYLNLIQHALPGFLVLFEILIVNHQFHLQRNLIENNNTYKKNLKAKISSSSIEYTPITSNVKQDKTNFLFFVFFYLSILVYTRCHKGFWLYPILEVIPMHFKILFIFIACGFGLLAYKVGGDINQSRWGGRFVFTISDSIK
ncbi:hypothetical protein CYY_009120 [Polysphondylium violaceum]|uniref:Uncharacterized protein n=1 Tax=Polysphondylium violaceum TaxID=133409 RepID=A0A8J4PM31_9MYCE|nr:hypothetical protein CYY_009120 [Polysphondylium violaceum]